MIRTFQGFSLSLVNRSLTNYYSSLDNSLCMKKFASAGIKTSQLGLPVVPDNSSLVSDVAARETRLHAKLRSRNEEKRVGIGGNRGTIAGTNSAVRRVE